MKFTSTFAAAILLACSLAFALLSERSTTAGGKKGSGGETSAEFQPVILSSNPGWPTAINALDGFVEVVGVLEEEQAGAIVQFPHYWLLDSTGSVQVSADLKYLPTIVAGVTPSAHALDINNQGMIVGRQYEMIDGSRIVRPVVWANAFSNPVELPLPAGLTGDAVAKAVNDSGVVVGTVTHAAGMSLVAWKVDVINGKVSIRDAREILRSANFAWFTDVANSGYACAVVNSTGIGGNRAIRLELSWDGTTISEVNGTRTELFAVVSEPYRVNDAGVVCGFYNPGDGVTAFAVTTTGNLIDLPVLPAEKWKGISYDKANNQLAVALNSTNPPQVIGTQWRTFTAGNLQGSETLVVRWTPAVGATNLEDATAGAPLLESVNDINNAGWIAATVFDENNGLQFPAVLVRSTQ